MPRATDGGFMQCMISVIFGISSTEYRVGKLRSLEINQPVYWNLYG